MSEDGNIVPKNLYMGHNRYQMAVTVNRFRGDP